MTDTLVIDDVPVVVIDEGAQKTVRIDSQSDGKDHRGANAPLTPEVIAQTESKLAALYGDAVNIMVLPGNPIAEIRRFARNKKMDLIIMGNSACSVEQAYREELREKASCPVMKLYFPKNITDVLDIEGEQTMR